MASASDSAGDTLEQLLGKNLVKKMGDAAAGDVTVATGAALAGKTQIGLYFSAHWCPPCRGFTPVLAKVYEAVKKADKNFEVVFISGDRDRKACKEYHDEMPWLLVPYENRDLEKALSKKFKVQGIPTLVILDGSGNLVTTNGRQFIGDVGNSVSTFPWKPPTVASALGPTLLTKDADGTIKEVKTSDALKGKNVALYFSAHWCPPCRGFTPKLAATYKSMKSQVQAGKRKDDFEVVFVSSDKNDAAFEEYYGEMPWLALPYANREGKKQLNSIFEVRGIPSLITLDEDYRAINKAARGAASGDPEGKEFPWFPKPVNDVNDVTDGLNDEKCVIVLLDGSSASDQETRMQDLQTLANKYYDEAKSKKCDPEFRFFFEKAKGSVSGQIRSLCKLGDGPKTLMLDLSDNGAFYEAKAEGDIARLISDFKKNTLDKKQAARS